jgi:hypothetical protein
MDNSNKKKEKNYIKKNINVKKIKLDKDKNTPELPKFKSLTAKNVSLKDKKLLRPTTSRFSANINNYRFLFDVQNKESSSTTNWVLNLRIFDDFKKRRKKSLQEPSFYQNDLEKFLKRKNRLAKSKSLMGFDTLSNYTQYKHFFKRNDDNHGTYLTNPLLSYNTNLRTDIHTQSPNKWISDRKISTKRFYYSCSNFYKNDIRGKLSDQNIMRPYKMEFSEMVYNGTDLWIKMAKRDDRKAYDVMGEHLASKPYNDSYKEKNVYKIKEFMKGIDASQSRIWYHINLRNYNQNSKNDRFNKDRKKWINY